MPAPKPTLVLVPGLLCDTELWRKQIDALSDVADCVVADVSRHPSIEAMAHRILAEIDGSFALAGLSMGGYVAQAIMRIAPERVTHLALLNTTARADAPATTAVRHDLIARSRGGEFDAVAQLLCDRMLAVNSRTDELVQTVIAMETRIGPDVFYRQQRAIIDRPDARAGLHAVHVPAVIIGGELDVITPPDVHTEMATLVPGARLVMLAGCGHLSTMERPREVTNALRAWLES